MTTQAVSHLAAIERGLLRVVTSLRVCNEDAGVCIEFYGRSPRNAWFEAVRVDGYLGDVHYHAFSEGGSVLECLVASTSSRDGVVQAVLEFACTEVRSILTDVGFAPAAADDATWEEVVGFLRAGVLTTFLALSADGMES